jgi:uncharacterized protein
MLPAIGYTLREVNRPILADPAINALEIACDEPGDLARILPDGDGHEQNLLSVQVPELAPANADFPGPEKLDSLSTRWAKVGATWLSAPLAASSDGRLGLEGGRSPAPCTPEVLDRCCRNIDAIEEHFAPLSFYVENTVYALRPAGTMSEADFLYGVLRQSGCGWLLNLTHVYAGATTFGFDPYEFIAEVLPAAERVQLRVAGGLRDQRSQGLANSRSYPIPEPVWSLYRHALSLCSEKVTAVFLGRDLSLAEESVWRREVRQIRHIAEDIDAAHVYVRKR